jgi:hypothetical protein
VRDQTYRQPAETKKAQRDMMWWVSIANIAAKDEWDFDFLVVYSDDIVGPTNTIDTNR